MADVEEIEKPEVPSSLRVTELTKHFRVHRREGGSFGFARTLFRRRYQIVKALNGITFSAGEGEIVGLVGPNGAGKTTLLKCLAGVLRPTSGHISALGFQPFVRDARYLAKIAFVTGQRNQLMWDIPAMETFLLNQAIYGIDRESFRQTLAELVSALELAPLIDRPVRRLSLGERMKCELAASLLHQPKILLLDEPTLGLDLNSQAAIRNFIQQVNRARRVTVVLSSHYLEDVVALATRMLLIDHGELLFDGTIKSLKQRVAPYKLLTVSSSEEIAPATLNTLGLVQSYQANSVVVRVPSDSIRRAAIEAFARYPNADIAIQDPPIEAIIREFFRSKVAETPHMPPNRQDLSSVGY